MKYVPKPDTWMQPHLRASCNPCTLSSLRLNPKQCHKCCRHTCGKLWPLLYTKRQILPTYNVASLVLLFVCLLVILFIFIKILRETIQVFVMPILLTGYAIIGHILFFKIVFNFHKCLSLLFLFLISFIPFQFALWLTCLERARLYVNFALCEVNLLYVTTLL